MTTPSGVSWAGGAVPSTWRVQSSPLALSMPTCTRSTARSPSRHVSCLPPAVDSLTGLKQRLADRAGSLPAGAWVVATGYDDTRLREKRHPSRLDVDSAVPHHPAVVGRVCGHMSVANTLALASAGIDAATPDPPGGTIVRDPTGAPTGLLLETAQDLVWRVTPPLSGPDIRHALSQIGRQILGYGITTICEALLGAFHPLELDIWSELLSAPWEGPRVGFLAAAGYGRACPRRTTSHRGHQAVRRRCDHRRDRGSLGAIRGHRGPGDADSRAR